MIIAAIMRRTSPRERRTIFIALAIALAAWLALRGIPWSLRAVGTVTEREVLARQAQGRTQALLAAEPLMRDSLAARAQRLVALAPRLFGGASASEATAEFSGLLSGIADRRRVRILRVDAQQATPVSVFHRLQIRIEAEGDMAGISSLLADIEGGEKLMSITTLQIQALEPAATDAQPERLRLSATIEGWATLHAEEARHGS